MAKKISTKEKVSILIEKAEKSISDAKRMGINMDKAEDVLKEARDLLKGRKGNEALKMLKEISNVIKNAKKKKRLEQMIFNTLPSIEDARQAGGEVTEAEEWLEKAGEMIEQEIFGTAQEYINRARREAEDAKRFVSTKELITLFSPHVERARRAGVDITEVMDFIMKAWEALHECKYGVVRTVMKDAKIMLALAEDSMEFVEMVRSIENRMKQMKGTEAVTAEMEGFLEEAKTALEEKDYASVRRNVKKIGDRLDKEILQKEAGLTVRTIEQFMREAKKSGIKSDELEGVLGRASAAFEEGRFEDMDQLKMNAKEIVSNLKLFDRLSSEDVRLMDDNMKEGFSGWITQEIEDSVQIVDTAKARGLDVSNIEGLIGQARTSLEENEYDTAIKTVQAIRTELGKDEGQLGRVRFDKAIEDSQDKLSVFELLGIPSNEMEGILDTARMMVEQNLFDKVDECLERFNKTLKDTTSAYLEGKQPRISMSVDGHGYEKQKWNRCFVRVKNIGNTPARDMQLSFPGDVEVKGDTSISRLMPKEEKNMEIALKSYQDGPVPLEITASYHRYFDDTKYQLNDIKNIDVDEAGSYIVEDVFLIHKSGIMIARETRRIEVDVDSDVFSAMLTAVTQFVNDSFKLSMEAGLNRMEFGDSKLLIERGEFISLVVTILGEESEFLPFYMTEIIRELEEVYGDTLSYWSGEMEQLEGIDEIVRKLIFVKEDKNLEMPVMPSSSLSPALKALAADAPTPELRENISGMVKELARDLNSKPYGDAVKQLIEIEQRLDGILDGVDIPGLKEERMDAVLQESVKGEIEAFSDLLHIVRAQGLDVSEEERTTGESRQLYDQEEYERSRTVLNRAKGSLKRKQSAHKSEEMTSRLGELEEQFSFAEEIGLDVSEFETALEDIKQKLEEGILDTDSLLKAVENEFLQKSKSSLEGKSPKIEVRLTEDKGLQKDVWNPVSLVLTNTGNIPARNINLKFPDNLEVKYLETVETLKPDEELDMELAVKPQESGKLPLEIAATYQRYLDPTKYQLNQASEVQVDEAGTFAIEDVLLIHKTGTMISKDTRRIKEDAGSDEFGDMLAAISKYAKESFGLPKESVVHRMEFGKFKVLIERGDSVFLALSVAGQESPFLPLYMVEAIKGIEDTYKEKLSNWAGDMAELEGIDKFVNDLMFIKYEGQKEVPLYQSSLLAPAVRAIADGTFEVSKFDGMQGKLDEMNTTVSREGFEAISDYLEEVQKLLPMLGALPTPATTLTLDEETLKKKIHNLLLKSDISLESATMIDDRLNVYLEQISTVREFVDKLRAEEEIPEERTIALIAIQHTNEDVWKEIASNLKTVVREQLNAVEVEIIGTSEQWKGLDIKIIINEALIREKYRHIASNVISVLKYMPAKNMADNLKKHEFTIGIEGQTVYITEDMVSAEFSIPEGVKFIQMPDGKIYVKLTMSEEAETKVLARSIVDQINNMREELELPEIASIEVQIFAPDNIADILDKIKDEISENVSAYVLELPFDDPFSGENDYRVAELSFKDENIKIGIIEVEFESD